MREIIAEPLIRNYIARTNKAYDTEVERIREVAQNYKISITMSGEIRSGHANNLITQPVLIESIKFIESGEISIETIVKRSQLVEEIPPKFRC